MLCEKCGTQIPENDQVCPSCGVAVAEAVPVPQSGENTAPAAEQESVLSAQMPTQEEVYGGYGQPPVKKKGVGKIIAGIVAAVVVVAGGITAAAFPWVNNFVRKNVMSPAEYYQYVEEKNVDSLAAEMQELAARLSGVPESESYKGSVDIDISDEAMNLIPGSAEYSWISDLGIDFSSAYNGALSGGDVALTYADKAILSAKVLQDIEKNMIYFGFPELSDTYLSADRATLYESFGVDLQTMQEISAELSAVDPDALSGLVSRYGKIVIANLNNVEKSGETIEVEGISENCTLLTVTVDAQNVKALADALVAEAAQDEELKTLLKPVLMIALATEESGYDENYAKFIEQLKSAVSEFSVEDIGEFKMYLKAWVNAKGEIVGRALEVEGASVKALYPAKGNKSALDLSVSAQTMSVGILGSNENGTGTYSVKYGDAGILTLNMTDFQCEQGKVNGSLALTLDDGFSSLLNLVGADTSMATMLSDAGISLSFEEDGDGQKSVLSVNQGESALASVTLATRKEDVTLLDPSAVTVVDLSDETALEAWVSEIDPEAFAQTLPEELSELVSGILMGMSEETYPDDQYGDEYVDDEYVLEWALADYVDVFYGNYADSVAYLAPEELWDVLENEYDTDFDTVYAQYEDALSAQHDSYVTAFGEDYLTSHETVSQTDVDADTLALIADTMYEYYGISKDSVTQAKTVDFIVTVSGSLGEESVEASIMMVKVGDGWYPCDPESGNFVV